jgi:hypothetical protein
MRIALVQIGGMNTALGDDVRLSGLKARSFFAACVSATRLNRERG